MTVVGQLSSTGDLEGEIARLRDLDLSALRARWHSMFRRKAPQHLPRHLIFKILAYHLQAERLGDLDKETRRFLASVPLGTDGGDKLRIGKTDKLGQGLRAGTVLVRECDGASQRVTVLDEGFAWNGKTYRSLSEVAFAITGTRWSGPRFFGLRDRPRRPA